MAWTIELDQAAVRDLDKLDQQPRRRILAFLHDCVATLDNPRSSGEALKGSTLGEFWKYRVGDYRVIASIEDRALCVLVVKIGNRSLAPTCEADPGAAEEAENLHRLAAGGPAAWPPRAVAAGLPRRIRRGARTPTRWFLRRSPVRLC